MKKILLLVIVLLILAAPYGAGFLVKRGYETNIQRLVKLYNGKLKIVFSFNNGWLTSKAKLDVVSMDNKPLGSINYDIKNGPVIFNFQGWLNPKTYIPQDYKMAILKVTVDNAAVKMLGSIYKRQDFYEATIKVDYQYNEHVTIKFLPLNLALPEGNLNFSAFHINGRHKLDESLFYMDISLPSFNYSENQASDNKKIQITDFKSNVFFNVFNLNYSVDFLMGSLKLSNDLGDVLTILSPALKFKEQKTNKDDTLTSYTVLINLKWNKKILGPLVCF